MTISVVETQTSNPPPYALVAHRGGAGGETDGKGPLAQPGRRLHQLAVRHLVCDLNLD